MRFNRFRNLNYLCASLVLLLALAPTVFAQATGDSSQQKSSATVASGQKMKIKGVVTARNADTFTVQDLSGATTNVLLTDKTSVKTKGGFLSSGTNYAVTNI
ncbi:MAG TPA: hypothetical protein VKB86_09640, partial [Pyrinomonadaceae bacterium]|nr:hypothetical protein [Pyrinomonadaceae bacterium]